MLKILVASLMMLVAWGCSGQDGGGDVTYTRLTDIPAAKLEALSQKSYFFGHQSVGRNMLDGLRALMAENPALKLQIVEGENAGQLKPGVFLHSNLGKNTQPTTKLDAFAKVMDDGVGGKVDAAFLKFCYVDLNREGNPAQLFANYTREVDVLKAKYPQTTFVHFTLPIKTVPGGLKVKAKNMLGREVPQQMDNVKRAEFNDLMRKQYQGKEPLFDIARFESIAPGTGKQYSFKQDGKVIESMAPENTNDGGHLTESGKRWIAEQLVVFLANLD